MRIVRRCTATKANGERCKAYALWNSPERKCSAHAYPHRHRPGRYHYHWHAPVCCCAAFNFLTVCTVVAVGGASSRRGSAPHQAVPIAGQGCGVLQERTPEPFNVSIPKRTAADFPGDNPGHKRHLKKDHEEKHPCQTV